MEARNRVHLAGTVSEAGWCFGVLIGHEGEEALALALLEQSRALMRPPDLSLVGFRVDTLSTR